MQKIYALAGVIFLCNLALAQTNKLDPNGNVGVGTTTPDALFHVTTNKDIGIKSENSMAIIQSKDAQLDLISTGDNRWGSGINLIEGNNGGSSNRNVWSIIRQTTAGPGNSSLRVNFGTNNSHENDSKITIAANGNVGIGEVGPDFRLQVRTPNNPNGPISYALDLTRQNSGTRGLTFGISRGTLGVEKYAVIGAHNADLRLGHTFDTGEDDGQPVFYPDLTIKHRDKSTGRVGIGTTNPDATLHTKGGIAIQNPSIPYDTKGDAGIRSGIIFGSNHETNNGMFWISPDATEGNKINIGSGASYDDTKSLLTITGHSNRVGVGTTSPRAKLDVEGSIKILQGWEELHWSSKHTETEERSYLAPRVPEGDDRTHYWDWNQEFGYNHKDRAWYFDGDVGIGTAIPKNKLSVNGTVWAKKFKCSLEDAADWVFKDDYDLRPLEEIESYIQENKHLPDVPSAQEFREKDLDVAQMDNLLLQKVEELTLYMIDMNKQMKQLKAENESLKAEVKSLKK